MHTQKTIFAGNLILAPKLDSFIIHVQRVMRTQQVHKLVDGTLDDA